MRGRVVVGFCALALWGALGQPVRAFYINGQWTTVAHGPAGALGTPTTLTWTIVPDGTSILFDGGTSNLISFLDGMYGAGPGGTNLAARPWFSIVDSAFSRWAELGGATFEYGRTSGGSYVVDDGVTVSSANNGVLNLRGDVRLAGTFLDGVGGTNASTATIVGGADVTLDTGDPLFFSEIISGSPNLNIRNTLAHEIGHSLGFAHTGISSFLMYPFSSTAYDGPQFDDVRAVQQQYGDAYEKAGGGAGNNSLANATPLGLIAAGTTRTIGVDGNTGTKVEPAEKDFVSVNSISDLDFYSFTLTDPAWVDVTATPNGVTYQQRPNPSSGSFTTVTSSSVSDLNLQLYALLGETWQLVGSAASNPIGAAESLLDSALTAGTYAVRVAGSTSVIQTYQLAIGVESRIPGDFDHDQDVDGADFLVWQRGLGTTYDADDLADWQANYGAPGLVVTATRAVPEPASGVLAAMALATLGVRRRTLTAGIRDEFGA